VSRYDRYSPTAMDILYAVQDIVRAEGRRESRLDDLSRAILISAIPDLLEIASRNERSLDREKLKELYARLGERKDDPDSGPISLSGEFRAVLDKAENMAGSDSVKPSHIIHAAWNSIRGDIAPYFGRPEPAGNAKGKGIDGEEAADIAHRRRVLVSNETEDGIPRPAAEISIAPENLRLPELEQSPERVQAVEFLSSLGRELTSQDSHFEVFGRDAEIESLASVLLKCYKPNPLIIGDPGVGKTAIVEGLAERIKAGRVPPRLSSLRIFELRLSDLAAGTAVHGAFEERLKGVIAAVEANPDLVVFFDEMHTLAQSYGNEPSADILKPALSRGKFRCIGAASVAEYHKFIERDEAFTRRFQTILVKEPGKDELMDILRGARRRLEAHYGLSVPDSALERAVGLSARHLSTRFFPDKALDVLDRACSKAFYSGERELGPSRLREAVTDIANVRFEGDSGDDTGTEGLADRIKRDVIGQDEAIERVCATLKICKRHLDLRPERPDGAFLFTGPTGVGKTALAESIAKRLSGRADALFRIDMSEFAESHTVSRLLGAPPGYVGYGDIALLAQAVEKNPSGVLLLDEFEKAHPQVHRLFLQILDSGRATDAFGKRLSFSDMTIIATCNVNDDQRSTIGFQGPDRSAAPSLPLAKLRQVFPPELLNRFDALIPFKPLSREDCLSILKDILIKENNRHLSAEYGFEIEYGQELLDTLLAEGFSPDSGARNLHRVFQQKVTLPLAAVIEKLRDTRRVKAVFEAGAISFIAEKSG
jgi:ATP-dependent Clp protease ATP-binding subunit ClpA